MRETLLQALKIALGIAIPLASFSTGVRAANIDPLWLFRRRSLLVRSLLSIFVLVPLATVFLLTIIKAPQAVSAGGPVRGRGGGRRGAARGGARPPPGRHEANVSQGRRRHLRGGAQHRRSAPGDPL